MIHFACDPTNNIRYVVVYNFSRYFRNPSQYLRYKDQLNQAGVRLVSATQEIPDSPAGELMENILAAFDGHASAVNSETVKAVMIANAEDQYWNGSSPPIGFKTEVVTILRKKEKKRLVVDDEEAVIVRLIFDLYLGRVEGAPKGIKAIAAHLNAKGYRRRGKLFYTATIERILKSEAVIGIRWFNKTDSKTRKTKPRSEWVKQTNPAIIDETTFLSVQQELKRRRPTNTPPRTLTGPTLLTGIAVCEHCRSGMLLRTGKSGAYRYLTCAAKALKGPIACSGHTIRMDTADEAILRSVEHEVFEPNRLAVLLGKTMERSDITRKDIDNELTRQRKALGDTTARLNRLYDAIETGIADTTDKTFRERIETLKLQHLELETAIGHLRSRQAIQPVKLTDEKVAWFGQAIKKRLREGDPAFRREWLRLFVSEVVIGPERISITGPKDVLYAAFTRGDKLGTEVPSFAREWRAIQNKTMNSYVIEISL